MIIVKLDGGMGNQLFQYAAGKYLAIKLNAELKLDIDIYTAGNKRKYALHHFAIQEKFSGKNERAALKRKEYISSKLRRLGFSIRPYWVTEENPGYHDLVHQLTDNVYLEGFWQSEKYFKPAEDIIRKEFVVKQPPSTINRVWLDKIQSVNAVSLHVRRGDYVTDAVTHAVHGVCEVDYYKAAIDQMTSAINDPFFFIFSDDTEWAKANLSIAEYPVEFISHNSKADHEDIRLMYSCRHHIIANSSFSWWGAWLNSYPGKKVIAPGKWFRTITNKDIIPDGWQTI